eukprot:9814310-Prorocentrum_lima.AAC.1
MTSSLVGSEMCIRDSSRDGRHASERNCSLHSDSTASSSKPVNWKMGSKTVSYTHLTLPTICSV